MFWGVIPTFVEVTGEKLVGDLFELSKQFALSKGSGITLTNNEIKDIMKVIKSLENSGVLLKGTTRKFTSQEGGFLNFLVYH